MPTFHSPDRVELEGAKLGDEEFCLIGRLIRACSLIEDSCQNYLSLLIRITPANLTILLGQMGINKKLSLAQNYASIRGKQEQERFNRLFDMQRTSEVLKCRNAVSHGYLLGRWPNGKWAFETNAMTGVDANDVASITVISFDTKDLKIYADWAEELAEKSSQDPYIQAQRKERQETPLLPSNKSQPKRKGP